MTTDIDLIIVPGFITEMEVPLQENATVIEWLKNQYEHHQSELASMCTGAFLLAATGALDNKKCTTHWAFSKSFARLFPKAILENEKIVTDHGGTYTSAGAFSSLNLLLYLVEKFADKETAIWLSKVFQVDYNRNSQKPFMILNDLYNHHDDAIKKLQEYIEEHYGEELLVGTLAKSFGFSSRTLVRRFKNATGISPLEFIQHVRIEAAKRMLENKTITINEIIFQCGYNDGATFRKVFKNLTGLQPSGYRQKYFSPQTSLS
ncbi:MAG: helix-turn-helix domain-containing protein [Bacteroidota bacterium]